MAVDLAVDIDITDNIQSVTATVTDDKNNSESVELIDGNWDYHFPTIPGDPTVDYDVWIQVSSDKFTSPTIRTVEVQVPGEHHPIESEQVGVEVEWSDHAIEDGSMTDTLDDYDVEIVSVGGDGRRFSPTSLSYSPAVNASKDLSLNTPHFDWLQGTKFLGSGITVYANDEVIYKGEVKNIKLNRNHDEFSISTKSFGKKLLGKSVDIKGLTGLATDAIAQLVDEANTVHSDYMEKVNTSDEELTDIVRAGPQPSDGIEVASTPTSGTATYYNIGPSAHDLNPLYVKAYAPDDIQVQVYDGENTYTETLDIYSENEFGKWYVIEPEGLDDAWYDITFTLNGNARIYDWRAIENRRIKRVVEPPDTSTGESNADLYDYNHDNQSTGIENVVDSNLVVPTTDGYRPRQKCTWHVGLTGDTGTVSTTMNAVDGACYTNSDYTQYELSKFNFVDPIPEWHVYARVAMLTDNGAGQANFDIIVNGDAYPHTLDSSQYDSTDFDWVKISDYTMSDSWSKELNESNTVDFRGETNGHGDEVGFAEFCIIVGDTTAAGLDFTYQFSDGLTNGHLSRPHRYEQGWVEFDETAIDGSLVEATVTADFDVTSNPQYNWGPVHSTDPSELSSLTAPNSSTNTKNFDGGHTHTVRAYLSGARVRDTGSPREGYYPQTLRGIDVNGSWNDFSRVYDRDVKGNILSQINTIAGDTTAMFRFEGDTIRIFEREQLWTDPDIRATDISSSASIEGVYKSCEVIGLNGVTSGVIEIEDAPEFVDDHKEIRDQSITSKREAVARAQAFLEKNGEVEYTGSIDTLPTFAPLGAFIEGRHFSHGEPMEIKSVSYSKSGASISLGDKQNVASELLALKQHSQETNHRVTD